MNTLYPQPILDPNDVIVQVFHELYLTFYILLQVLRLLEAYNRRLLVYFEPHNRNMSVTPFNDMFFLCHLEHCLPAAEKNWPRRTLAEFGVGWFLCVLLFHCRSRTLCPPSWTWFPAETSNSLLEGHASHSSSSFGCGSTPSRSSLGCGG
jgi:hypothetical protein